MANNAENVDFLPSDDIGTLLLRGAEFLDNLVDDIADAFFAEAPSNPDSGVFMPDYIGYQLAHGGGISKASTIKLCDKRGFEDVAIYYAFKHLDSDPVRYESLLKELFAIMRVHGEKEYLPAEDFDGVSEAIKKHIDHLPDDAKVGGSKIALITRMGPYFWRDSMRDTVRDVLEDREKTPMLVANSMLTALSSVARIAPTGEPIAILAEERLKRQENPCGWILTPTETGCEIEALTLETPVLDRLDGRMPVFMDDVLKTGSTYRDVAALFETLPNYPTLDPDSAVFMVVSGGAHILLKRRSNLIVEGSIATHNFRLLCQA